LRREMSEMLLLTVQARVFSGGADASPQTLLTMLERAAALDEPTSGYHRLRADCHRLAGDNALARHSLQLAADPRTAKRSLDHFLLGEQYRVASLNPNNPNLDNRNEHLNRVSLLRAIEEYRLALQKDPKHFWAHLQLGRCLLALGRHAEAVEILGTCVSLRPESPWGYNSRGAALVQMRHYDQAQKEFQRLLQRLPDFLPARLNLGRACQLSGKLDEALKQYEIVLAAPERQRLMTAAYYRGTVRLARGNLAEPCKISTASLPPNRAFIRSISCALRCASPKGTITWP